MAAAKNTNVSVTMKILGWRNLVSGAEQSAKALAKLGKSGKDAADEAGSSKGWGIFEAKADKAGKKAKESGGRFASLAKSAAAFGVGYEAISGIKESVDATKELSEASLNLNSIQGLSVKQAGQFAMIAQVRGIGQAKLAQGFTALGRNSVNAVKQWNAADRSSVASSRATTEQLAAIRNSYDQRIEVLGNNAADQVKKQMLLEEKHTALVKAQSDARFKAKQREAKGPGNAAAAFKALGFTQADVAAGSKDLGTFTDQIAERFTKMRGGALKTQIGQQLFGRGGTQGFLPLFKEGSESLKQDRKWAAQFGVSMPKNAEQLKAYLRASDKSKYATLGLQQAIGTQLVPALTKVIDAWPTLVQNIKKGTGAWGTVRTVIDTVSTAVRTVVGLFAQSRTASKLLVWSLAALGAAWGVEKAFKYYQALKSSLVVTKGLTLAQAGLRRSMGQTAVVAGENTAATTAETTASSLPAELSARKSLFKSAGRSMGGWIGLGAAAVIAEQITARGFGDLLSAVGDANVATDSNPSVRKGEKFIHSTNSLSQLKKWGVLNPALNKKIHQNPTWSTSTIKALIKAGYPGLIPGSPGVPKNYSPPLLAKGGTLTSSGAVIVGERGPELLSLPRGASVNPRIEGMSGMGDLIDAIYALAGRPSQLVVSGKVLAHTSAQSTQKELRRVRTA